MAPQCLKDMDCASHDAAVSNLVCNTTTYTCVKPTPVADSGSDATPVEASVDAGGCNTNADCAALAAMYPTHPEVACDVDTHTCLHLTSDECPIVVGTLNDTMYPGPPTFVGTFIAFPNGDATQHPTYLNYLLALNEFKKTTNGIPTGVATSNSSRMPLGIGCDVAANVDNAMSHLINDVHVPAVVSSLPPQQLSAMFQNDAFPANVFVVDSLASDPTFNSITTDQLLWHMLGQPGDAAPAYAAFIPVLENYLRNNAPQPIGPTAPLKIATITANSTATFALASAVEAVLTWNGGKTIAQNGSANYLAITLSDSTLNGAMVSGAFADEIEMDAQTVADFQPNIVISFASEEFNTFFEALELDWEVPNQLPFYLLGPYDMGSPTLPTILNNYRYNTQRFAGIGVAATSDPTAQLALTDYESRFLAAYPGRSDALGQENFYDAMYFALYALTAAGKLATPQGSDLAKGMSRLIDLNSTAKYSVGPGSMGNVDTVLTGSRTNTLELIGTLGDPNFDTQTGARLGAGDVYCLQPADGSVPYVYAYDVLRLVNVDGSAPDGGSAFTGSFPCYSGIQ
jgi:hypothetical protein